MISKNVVHFNRYQSSYDLVLLQTKDPLPVNSNLQILRRIKPVCLPETTDRINNRDQRATVIGWGAIGHGDNDPSANILQKVQVVIKSDERYCERITHVPAAESKLLCTGSHEQEGSGAAQVND